MLSDDVYNSMLNNEFQFEIIRQKLIRITFREKFIKLRLSDMKIYENL